MGLLAGAGDGSSVLGSFSLFSGVVGVTGAMTLSGGSATVGGGVNWGRQSKWCLDT